MSGDGQYIEEFVGAVMSICANDQEVRTPPACCACTFDQKPNHSRKNRAQPPEGRKRPLHAFQPVRLRSGQKKAVCNRISSRANQSGFLDYPTLSRTRRRTSRQAESLWQFEHFAGSCSTAVATELAPAQLHLMPSAMKASDFRRHPWAHRIAHCPGHRVADREAAPSPAPNPPPLGFWAALILVPLRLVYLPMSPSTPIDAQQPLRLLRAARCSRR